MRRTLQFLSLSTALLVSGAVAAQNGRIHAAHGTPGKATGQFNTAETTSCGPDVSDYVFMKQDTVPATNANTFYFLEMWPGEMASTAYILDQPAMLAGVMFVARVAPGNTAPINVEVGAWTTSGYEPTTSLGTATVNATSNANFAFYQATFATPIAVSDTFAVSIKNTDGLDTLHSIINDYAEPLVQEGLSYYDWQGGVWETVNDVYGIDAEFRILPILTYDIDADFSFPNVTNCIGNSIQFTNSSSSILWNRMFNTHAFDTYFLGEVDSTFAWDFGDASGIVYGSNPMHTYTAAGTYTITLTANIKGVLADCQDVQTAVITVNPNVASSFTYDASMEPMVSFMDASTGTDANTTYMWDFGDGNTSTSQNPTHTYVNTGTYTVTLMVAGPCGNSTTTQTVTITTVGVNEVASVNVNAFYNSSEQMLNVILPGSANATLEVYNAVGAKIFAESGVNVASKQIGLNGLANGTYMVRVITANGIGATKFVVIK